MYFQVWLYEVGQAREGGGGRDDDNRDGDNKVEEG
jgi:hypothetical protein